MTDQRPDRLSTLINRFRVRASVPSDGAAPANLFIHERAGGWHLLYLPRGTTSAEDDAIPSRILARAQVDTGGAANPIARALPDRVAVDLREASDLAGVAELLVAECQAPRCGGGAVIDRLCEVLVIRLLRHLIERGSTEPGLIAGLADANLSLAIVAVHDRPAHPWRLEDLAAIAGLSRTHFANRFRAVLGVTPGDYLSGWRLTLARHELARGAGLKRVARQVGFSGPASLSRAFRRRFGVSPREDAEARP